MLPRPILLLFFFVLCPTIGRPADAQVSVKLTRGTDGSSFDYFGEAVAIDGSFAIVGSWLDDNTNGKDAGAAFVYQRIGPRWELAATLRASDGEAGDQFGAAVAIDGDVAVVGARRDDNENGPFAGAAYVFIREAGGWREQARLVAPAGAFDDRFGTAVAISGDRVVIGAPGYALQRGAAFVYRNGSAGWSFEARLEAADVQEGDAFGAAVALDGGFAVVGSESHDTAGLVDAGAAFVFSFTGQIWAEQATLTAETPVGDSGFGASVSISGSYVLVGSAREPVLDRDEAGTAYAFVRSGSTWSPQARLLPFASVEGDEFGSAVHLSGSYALVGARWHRNSAGEKTGIVYLFERFGASWSLEAELIAADGAFGDQFGSALGFSDDQAIVGARWDDNDAGQDAGAAYIFPVGGSGQPALLTSTSGITFGGAAVGESIDGSFRISNIGTADLDVTSLAIAGDGASSFRLTAGGPAVLAPLAQIDATVRFSPQSPGTKSARLVIASNAADSPHEIALTGTGNDGLQPGMARVLASRGDVEPRFGATVAVSGDYAIVGAEGAGGDDPGSAYVYRRSGDTWIQQTRLTANEGAGGDRFGSAVAIDGDRAVVGAWNAEEARGAAYVFVRSGSAWVEQARLTAGDGLAGDRFGRAVAIDGDIVAVGAPFDDNERGLDGGSVYLFHRSGGRWSFHTRLAASDGRQSDRFGSAVAVRGQNLVAGAENGGFFGEGRAYVFGFDGAAWDAEGALSASDGGLSDGFGTTLAIEDDIAVVGAPKRDGTTTFDEGGAYVFERTESGWIERTRLSAPDAASGAAFGAAVAIEGGVVVVGASGVDNQRGAAYVYSRNDDLWLFDVKIGPIPGSDGDGFGGALGLSGGDLIVGAPDDDNLNGSDAGAVYFYNRIGLSWGQRAAVIASNRVVQPYFGSSVAVSGTRAVVGARGDAGAPGAAYVYEKANDGWRQTAELVASDGEAGDAFGAAVAIEGNLILVGAPGDDTEHGIDAGAIYVFLRGSENWSEQARIAPADAAASDAFGTAVALQDDEAFGGAPAAAGGKGVAYVFRQDGADWPETDRLVASDGRAGDAFGHRLSVDGVDLIVGAPREGPFGSGAAYVFRWDGLDWNPEAKLFASSAGQDDGFGSAVALDGDYAILGAPGVGEGDEGAVYVFRRSGGLWGAREWATIRASDRAAGHRFGQDVAISDSYVLVGADGADAERGAAYVLQRSGTSWLEKARLAPTDDGGADRFGMAVDLDGDHALVGAQYDSNGNGAKGGAAYLISLTGQITLTTTENAAPAAFALDQNYPNPFREQTTIRYVLDGPGSVSLRVFDLIGREVDAPVLHRAMPAGEHLFPYDASHLSAGVYFYRLEYGDTWVTRRFVVVR
jgi:hypothetical protein